MARGDRIAVPSARAPGSPVLFGLVIGIFGAALLWGGWSMASDAWYLAAKGVRTEAQVVSVDERRQRSVSTYTPTFMFWTGEGRVVRERSTISLDSNAEWAGNRRVTVVYDPADPSRVRPASTVDGGAGVLPWILGVMGLAVLALGGFVLIRRPRAAGPNT